MRKTGTHQILGATSYFIPDPLPPANPTLIINDHMLQIYEQAMLALGKLNEAGRKLPNKERFIKAYIFKEALLSSEIENIQTTLLDVFTQACGATPINKEINLIVHYTQALYASLQC